MTDKNDRQGFLKFLNDYIANEDDWEMATVRGALLVVAVDNLTAEAASNDSQQIVVITTDGSAEILSTWDRLGLAHYAIADSQAFHTAARTVEALESGE